MDLKPHRTRTISLFIIVLTISSLLIGMEAVRDDDFLHYESAKYSTISQNILRSGDGLNLRDRRTPFEGDHPPLVFWVNAVFIDLLGETVFAAVLFSVICAVLTCAAVFIAGCILENDIVGFFASTGLLLTRYVVRVARFNTVDIPLMFFVTASVLFLLLALKRDKIFYILFGIMSGLAVLTKGVAGILPLGIGVLAVIYQGRIKDLFHPSFILGIAGAVFIPAMWLYLKGIECPLGAGAVINRYFDFVSGHFNGYGGQVPSRMRIFTQVFEICFIIAPGFIIGVSYVVRDQFRGIKKEGMVMVFWAIMFLAPVLAAAWRRGMYLLPIYPALALLFGIGLFRILPEARRILAVSIMIAFFAGNISAPFLFPHWEHKRLRDVIFKNTYYPGARKAVELIFKKYPAGIRFIAYLPGSAEKDEFVYMFSSQYKIDILTRPDELREILAGGGAVLVYIFKDEYSRLGPEIHKNSKIVYAYEDKLLVTNIMKMTPVFGKVD